jgi:hypothetical protein
VYSGCYFELYVLSLSYSAAEARCEIQDSRFKKESAQNNNVRQTGGTGRQSGNAEFKIPDSRRDLRKITTSDKLVAQRGRAAMRNSRFQIQEGICAK